MKYFLTLVLSLSFLTGNAQMTINDVTLPATLKFNEQSLVLNGGGIRTKLIFNLYVGGLYLPAKSSNANKIISSDSPTAVRMVITSNKINSSNMSEAIEEGFEKSTGGDTERIQSSIDKLIKTFSSSPIVPGDIFDLVYLPGVGVQSYKNGQLATTIPGLDFKQALFGIWLSDNPVSGKLKSGMLGQ